MLLYSVLLPSQVLNDCMGRLPRGQGPGEHWQHLCTCCPACCTLGFGAPWVCCLHCVCRRHIGGIRGAAAVACCAAAAAVIAVAAAQAGAGSGGCQRPVGVPQLRRHVTAARVAAATPVQVLPADAAYASFAAALAHSTTLQRNSVDLLHNTELMQLASCHCVRKREL